MAESKKKVGTQTATNPHPGNFPLGSPQSRAAARLRLQEATGLGRTGEECICFPPGEEPFFLTNEDQKRAAKIECPLHGKRFEPRFHLYVSAWRWEIEVERRWQKLSVQYRKAFAASFSEGHPLREAVEAITGRDQQPRSGEADVEIPNRE
jgi:hypothetical protein